MCRDCWNDCCEAGYHAGLELGRWYPSLKNCLSIAVTEKTHQEGNGRPGGCVQGGDRGINHASESRNGFAVRNEPSGPALPSVAGVRCAGRAAGDVVAAEHAWPTHRRRCRKSAEIDLIRHFVNLSKRNMSIDTNFYPLGSCTMKYNPKRHERLAALPGLANMHPLADGRVLPGHAANALGDAEHPRRDRRPRRRLAAAGRRRPGRTDALCWSPRPISATAGKQRTRVLIPDSAHGTNPASAAIAGFETVSIKSNAKGLVDLDDLKAKLDDKHRRVHDHQPEHARPVRCADRRRSPRLLHDRGALVYLDGANMNAILGITRPGDFGADMMHYNVHKTFTGPHGAGGPGSGPIAVRSCLAPYLPAPIVVKEGGPLQAGLRPAQIDRPGAQLLRQRRHPAARLLLHPHARSRRPEGNDRKRRAQRQLSARQAQDLVRRAARRPLHARVRRQRQEHQTRERHHARWTSPSGLLDFGYHAPTVYFPLVVPEAMMIEPTETESKETLDAFAETMLKIRSEDAEFLHQAPHNAGHQPARRNQGRPRTDLALE